MKNEIAFYNGADVAITTRTISRKWVTTSQTKYMFTCKETGKTTEIIVWTDALAEGETDEADE